MKGSDRGAEAHRWLQVLRGEEDLRELLDDDDEDEDFTLDWDELMGANPFGEGAPPALFDSDKGCPILSPELKLLCIGPIFIPSACIACMTSLYDVDLRHRLYLQVGNLRLCTDERGPPPPPRRSQRQRAYKYVYENKNERPGHKERPVESTTRVQSKCATISFLYPSFRFLFPCCMPVMACLTNAAIYDVCDGFQTCQVCQQSACWKRQQIVCIT